MQVGEELNYKLVAVPFIPVYKVCHFSLGDSFTAMSNPVFWENRENIIKYCLLRFLHSVQRIKFLLKVNLAYMVFVLNRKQDLTLYVDWFFN